MSSVTQSYFLSHWKYTAQVLAPASDTRLLCGLCRRHSPEQHRVSPWQSCSVPVLRVPPCRRASTSPALPVLHRASSIASEASGAVVLQGQIIHPHSPLWHRAQGCAACRAALPRATAPRGVCWVGAGMGPSTALHGEHRAVSGVLGAAARPSRCCRALWA